MSSPILLTGGACLAGTGLEEMRPARIVVDDGSIKQIGSRSTEPADEIDLRDLTLIPGFIDAHVHIGFFPPGEVLLGGVTTVRDLGWPPALIKPLVEESTSSGWPGPRIVAAGPMLTCPGGYPTRAAWAPAGTGRVVEGIEDARTAVEERVADGSTIVKVALNPAAGPVLERSVLEAICEHAHENGLRVTGHIFGLSELHKGLDAGLDELAHMLMSPDRIPDETLARMVEQDVACVPTLAIHRWRMKRVATENLSRFAALGGRVVYGTDLGNGPRPGIDPREVRCMTDAGMDGRAIIASATVRSAQWLGIEKMGVLAAGMQADIIGVRGNPLVDPRCLADVRFVMRAGVVHRGPR
ncbi:MAG: hypothetical protein QOK47_1083 [Actinomycetota bacterium]|jgi:imidazolonepropionase-like amidohydrolase|nr:hypothetical protein [Actinomycetota bacterium]